MPLCLFSKLVLSCVDYHFNYISILFLLIYFYGELPESRRLCPSEKRDLHTLRRYFYKFWGTGSIILVTLLKFLRTGSGSINKLSEEENHMARILVSEDSAPVSGYRY